MQNDLSDLNETKLGDDLSDLGSETQDDLGDLAASAEGDLSNMPETMGNAPAAPGEAVIQAAPGALTEFYRRVNKRAGIAPTELPAALWEMVKGTGGGISSIFKGGEGGEEAAEKIGTGLGAALKGMSWPFRAVGEAVNMGAEAVGGNPVFPGPAEVPPSKRGTMGEVVETIAPFGPQIARGIAKHTLPGRLQNLIEGSGLEYMGINTNTHGQRVLFTDPETRTALAMPVKDVTPKTLAEHVAASRAEFKAGDIIRGYRDAVEKGQWVDPQDVVASLVSAGTKAETHAGEIAGIKVKQATDLLQNYKEMTKLGVEGFTQYNTEESLRALGYKAEQTKALMEKALKPFAGKDTLVKMATEGLPDASLISTTPTSAANAVVSRADEIGGGFHRALTLMLKDVSHPETVLSLEEPGKVVYSTMRNAERRIVRDVSRLEKVLLGATEGLSKEQLTQVGMILDGQKVQGAAPSVELAAKTIRRHILDPIAKMHGLDKEGRLLADYFPHFFNEQGVPIDVIDVFAKELAAKQELVWEKLSSVQQGKFIEQATEALRKLPQQTFFGPISKHRLTENVPFNFNAADVTARYIRGAIKKYYLDDALLSVRASMPSMSPALKEYTVQFVNAFRGVPVRGEVMTNQGIAAMLDAMEKVPGVGKKMASSYQTLFGTSSREFFNTLKMVQADAKLGANLFSPIQNLSQTSINTYTKVGGKTLVDALKMRYTTKGKELLERSGVFYDVAKYDLMPEELAGIKAKFTDKLLFLFNKSETFNREIAYLAGYLKAQKANPATTWNVLDSAGRHLVDETQFIFSVVGRPSALTTPMGSTMGQFKLFTINQLRFIKNLKGAEVPRFVLSTALHGGMKGVPGLNTAIKTVAGYEAVQAIKDSDLPEFAQNLILGGLPRAAGISLENDVGMGFVPGSAKELLPATLTLPAEVIRSGGEAWRGEPAAKEGITREAIRNLPGGIQAERIRQAIKAASRGGVKIGKEGRFEQVLKPADIAFQGALGAKTTSAAKFQEAEEFMAEQSQEIKTAKHILMSEVTKSLADNDMKRFDAALAKAAKTPGVLEGTDLKAVMRPSLVREFMSMPKLARVKVLTENPGFRNLILNELASQGVLMEGGE